MAVIESSNIGVPERTRLDFFHSPTQFRHDSWHRLAEYSVRLLKLQRRGEDLTDIRKRTASLLNIVSKLESYSAFPGNDDLGLIITLFEKSDYRGLIRCVESILRSLSNGSYRQRNFSQINPLDPNVDETEELRSRSLAGNDDLPQKPYFEVLFVDKNAKWETKRIKQGFQRITKPEDDFYYDVVGVSNFEDALIAVLFNYNIQACVIRYEFPLRSKNHIQILQRYIRSISDIEYDDMPDIGHGPLLGALISELRPELDLYLVTDESVEVIAGSAHKTFRRIFYRQDDYLELHHNLLRGIQQRYETPFFNALRSYSRRPTGVFHAMPISRAKSIINSHWIKDMVQFYGVNIFLAETSATSGGLDSLLQPHGPIKRAQELAARAFGARQTYFVTNGTSTANKIVVQALVKPRDVVLVDRDCHKSHHYGMVLSGAHVSYLDSYPLHEFSMYGAVPIAEIKARLLMYRDQGRLHEVRMLLLTNCTFDGVVYNVERVMEECLAIKPDLIFLWDEAWFAFAAFTPTYRQRTGMASARKLLQRYRSDEYRVRYEAQQQLLDGDDSAETLLKTQLLPDPDKVRVRVYTTQSTHKSLTSLRQGSMIHIFDQNFKQEVAETFHAAFMTHTSTSPNYQILASLDLGRRQAELEGYEMVQNQIELAMSVREQIARNTKLSRYFRFLVAHDMIPPEHRQSGIEAYFDTESGWANDHLEQAWESDEFVIDPTRLTLYIGKTGIDGDTFKNQYLMDRHGIQVNKTSRNTVLFMTNIGTTRSSVAFLIDVLSKIASELDAERDEYSRRDEVSYDKRVASLTKDLPPLPDFSRFHQAFLAHAEAGAVDGNLRKAFFLSYDADSYEYIEILDGKAEDDIRAGKEYVSAGFVIPYPPGFPILVPGQIVSADILLFMRKLDVKEIHGYEPEFGLAVFKQSALDEAGNTPP